MFAVLLSVCVRVCLNRVWEHAISAISREPRRWRYLTAVEKHLSISCAYDL